MPEVMKFLPDVPEKSRSREWDERTETKKLGPRFTASKTKPLKPRLSVDSCLKSYEAPTQTQKSVEPEPEVIFTFLLGACRHVWILGLFLDVEVDVVLLHVEVDGGSGVAVHHRLEAADRRSLARAGRVWTQTVTKIGAPLTDSR